MPLTKKGKEIMKSMKEQYGNKKGESIFYASKNKGTIKGVEKASKGKMMKVEKVKGALEKASKLHAAQAKTLGTVLKAAGGGLKEATKKLKAQGYTGGNMVKIKARYGTMAKGDIKKGLESSKTQRQKKEDLLAKVTMKLAGAQVSKAEANRIKSLAANIDRGGNKADVEAKKQSLKSLMKNMPKMKVGNIALKNPKKADLNKDGKLSGYEMKRGKAIEENMGVKKGKIMKAAMGKSVRGYGAARTSGLGLQDEQLIPGKSLDYYKDLM